jgi:transcriptional regulator of acetoin/glycerol metabolism
MDFLVLQENGPTPWERFVTGRLDRAQSELLERWERVQQLGVDPNGPEKVESIVTDIQLRQRRGQLDQLLAAGGDVLESTAAAFSDRDFVLLLADRDGVVLETYGGGEFESHARRVRLIEGAEWAEGVRGTNAIGTALTEARPVVVGGYAHFERVNHNLLCYACPIRNPAGDVVAVLDATSYAQRLDPMARVAVQSAAAAVEATWRRAVYAGLGHSGDRIEQRLERSDAPAFLVVPGGAITQYNQSARQRLRGRPANIQQTLGVQWARIHDALASGADTLRLQEQTGVQETSERIHLEPLFDDDEIVGTLVRLESTPAAAGRDSRRLRDDTTDDAFADIFGDDPALTQSTHVAARFARSSLPVLLLAETGTGKDLMANAIHRASDRADGPFMAVNCGALTPSLLESELFGYGPGAFTGASKNGREGRIGGADGGTLFLDEVAEMPPTLQTLLLRVLEDGTYNRVGELESRHSDIRLVCATCRDLPAMVERGEFRKDLYYRIRGATVTLPPLRKREDIVDLAEYLLGALCDELARDLPSLATEAVRWMRDYDWPGNVRELKNALHHALVLSDGADLLRREFFPEADATPPPTDEDDGADSIEDAERRALLKAQRATDGNVTEMARRLGVARTTVYRMLKRHGLRSN